MNPKAKKYLIGGLIGLVTVTGAIAYIQYQRLMNYVLSFKKIFIRTVNANYINFDLILGFENKSNVAFSIERQEYDVYVNDVYITKLKNNNPVKIDASKTSDLLLNIELNPKDLAAKLNKNILVLLAAPDKLKIKVDCKLKVKLWFFTVNIPYVYEDTLKNIMSSPTTDAKKSV
jgi:LEA14-like dessication related protein